MGGFGSWSHCPLSRRTESRWGPCLYSNQESNPWDSLSKGQILDHPHNNPCLSTEKSLSPLMIYLLIFFSFLVIFQRSLMVPKDIPTLLSRKFHRCTLNSHSSGKSDNGPAQNVLKLPFSICPIGTIGARIHWKVSAIWQWGHTPGTFTVDFYSEALLKGRRQRFSALAGHQYRCHLGRFEKY